MITHGRKTCPRRDHAGNIRYVKHAWSRYNEMTEKEEQQVADVRRKWRSQKHPEVNVQRMLVCWRCGAMKLNEPPKKHAFMIKVPHPRYGSRVAHYVGAKQ